MPGRHRRGEHDEGGGGRIGHRHAQARELRRDRGTGGQHDRVGGEPCAVGQDDADGHAVLHIHRRLTGVLDDPLQPGEIAGADAFVTSAGALRTTPADLQLGTPGISGLDGFFAARMRRVG